MEDSYRDVIVRNLADSERHAFTNETQTPLVIEAKNHKSLEFLHSLMKENSSIIISDVEKYGAVLFRGFDVRSPKDFENQILSIHGMKGMNNVMMSEPGRIIVDGTRYVMYTNKYFKTGGTLSPVGGFHCENYYVPDVPRFISFFCERASFFGGETGLINTARLYDGLPNELKDKLEKQACLVKAFSISEIKNRYHVTDNYLKGFLLKNGMRIIDHMGNEYAIMYKPSVITHPATKERALNINLSAELNKFGLYKELLNEFLPDYSSLQWSVHRFAWRFPGATDAIFLVSNPMALWIYCYSHLKRLFNINHRNKIPDVDGLRVGDIFEPDDVKLIAKLMRRHYSSFLWRRGDFIIIDNLKMAHAGMPGFGPRRLKAIICNPTSITYGKGASGIHTSISDDLIECLGVKILKNG
ncbi:TauD/TfdA family dioxygenase [Mycetohabitans rhizoxinica]|uniref:TauD/TfdA family dioxygenase n=1 Tax=Mycetohabitans rhizoxinica TaxID=412963 RepID=A0ABZ2PZK0_9BURK